MKYLLLGALATFIGGCAEPSSADSFTRFLPAGTTLSNPVLDGAKPTARATVAGKLAELGAHVGEDGRLYDWGGREISFWYVGPGQGRVVPDEERQREVRERERKLAELRKRYTVVIILYDGPPVP